MRTAITLALLCAYTFLSAQGLVINEIIASNDSTSMIMDDSLEYDDWVELYNNTNEAIDMSGYYFSDKTDEPDKWRFPNGISIAANGYLIVWTDSDNSQGDLHTNFKLSKSGESLILSDSFLTVLDSISFGEQETNVAFARIPNGTGDFAFRTSTFNANNDGSTDGIFTLNVRKDFEVYPNPTAAELHVDFTKTTGNFDSRHAEILISDTSGKTVLRQPFNSLTSNSIIELNVSHLASGIHFLKIQTASEVFLKKIMIEKHD